MEMHCFTVMLLACNNKTAVIRTP